MSNSFQTLSYDYGRIEQAIRFVEDNFHSQPTLGQIARHVHLSEHHFQRLFSRWVGISPKRFLQFLTKEHAKTLLQNSLNVLEATYESGLSSPGRLHDLLVACDAVTPGEFRSRGETLQIEYGLHASPFGECLIAVTGRGVCWLEFVQDGQQAALEGIKKRWQSAQLVENKGRTGELVQQIFAASRWSEGQPIHVLLKGTNFQIKVWEALLRIPFAKAVTYADIANAVGRPKAVRAVANAVAKNPVPFLIPCHRVIRKMGDFGGYAGGRIRKKAILGWESAVQTR